MNIAYPDYIRQCLNSIRDSGRMDVDPQILDFCQNCSTSEEDREKFRRLLGSKTNSVVYRRHDSIPADARIYPPVATVAAVFFSLRGLVLSDDSDENRRFVLLIVALAYFDVLLGEYLESIGAESLLDRIETCVTKAIEIQAGTVSIPRNASEVDRAALNDYERARDSHNAAGVLSFVTMYRNSGNGLAPASVERYMLQIAFRRTPEAMIEKLDCIDEPLSLFSLCAACDESFIVRLLRTETLCNTWLILAALDAGARRFDQGGEEPRNGIEAAIVKGLVRLCRMHESFFWAQAVRFTRSEAHIVWVARALYRLEGHVLERFMDYVPMSKYDHAYQKITAFCVELERLSQSLFEIFCRSVVRKWVLLHRELVDDNRGYLLKPLVTDFRYAIVSYFLRWESGEIQTRIETECHKLRYAFLGWDTERVRTVRCRLILSRLYIMSFVVKEKEICLPCSLRVTEEILLTLCDPRFVARIIESADEEFQAAYEKMLLNLGLAPTNISPAGER